MHDSFHNLQVQVLVGSKKYDLILIFSAAVLILKYVKVYQSVFQNVHYGQELSQKKNNWLMDKKYIVSIYKLYNFINLWFLIMKTNIE